MTEGDPWPETLQEIATPFVQALRLATMTYVTLAQPVRYEHVHALLNDPRFEEAMAKLEQDDRSRQSGDFTLPDLNGKRWTLKELRGSIVLANFWATWCRPCRKEMPDLGTPYRRFGQKG